MGCILDFKNNISKILNIKDLILVSRSKSLIYSDEDDIFNSMIRPISRITIGNKGPVSFSILTKSEYNILGFSIVEYPSCCGKLIIHDIYSYTMIHSGLDSISITTEQSTQMFREVLNLVESICNIMYYSSVDFIISDVEQPIILKCVKNLGLQSMSSFKNRRNNYKHTCSTYSLNIDEEMKITQV